MAAAYMLYELYSDEAGAAMVDGDILDGGEAVGWLNQILKTEFTREKRLDRLWSWAKIGTGVCGWRLRCA